MLGKFVLLVLVFAAVCDAVMMDVAKDATKCIFESYEHDVLVVGKYSFPNDEKGLSVNIEVFDPRSEELFSKKMTDTAGKFALTTKLHGDHSVCFTVRATEGAAPSETKTKRIEFEIKHGVEAKDYSSVVKTEHLTTLDLEMRRMEDAVKAILDELRYMKKREERMRQTNDSSLTRVLGFGLFSIAVMIGLAVWQLYHLEKFFRAKKII